MTIVVNSPTAVESHRLSCHFAMITEGLPGPGYHGGAVASWAVLEAMLDRGHTVTVIGLMDPGGPYAAHRDEQVAFLQEHGIEVRLVDFSAEKQRARNSTPRPGSIMGRMLRLFDRRTYDLWSVYHGLLNDSLQGLSLDGIFCYHFEPVSALSGKDTEAPITVCAVDLYHLPAFERWRERTASFAKYTRDLFAHIAYSYAQRRMMTDLFRRCQCRIEFAPHYAKWFRKRAGCEDTLYIPTPVHDPVGSEWRQQRSEPGLTGGKPRILMIGDLSGTATASGLRLCRDHVFPELENQLGADGFEVRLVGGGQLTADLKVLESKPYIVRPGRVMPPDAEFLSADVVLVPTPHTLGVRVRILNAFSYGCCVVSHTGNCAGIPEIVHGENALVANDGPGLAQEVLRATRDPHLARGIGEKGRAIYEKHFAASVAGTRVVVEMERLATGAHDIAQDTV